MKKFELTPTEQDIIDYVFSINGCGAETWAHLSEDNFSYFDESDLHKKFTELSKNQIAGYLGSMTKKGVFSVSDNGFETTLYISEEYIESKL